MKRIRVGVLNANLLSVEILSMSTDEFNYTHALVEGFPQRRWSRSAQCWKVPRTPESIRYLKQSFRDDEVELTADAKTVVEYQVLTEASQTIRQRRRWEYLFEAKVPDYEWVCSRTPYKHQIVAADAAVGAEFFALLMEMGTGKTLVSIEVMAKEVLRRRANGDDTPLKVLAIVPKTLIPNWLEEIDKAGIPESIKVWKGRVRSRAKGVQVLIEGMRSGADLMFFVVNYDRVESLKEALIAMEFGIVLTDEVTNIKNPSAHRSKAVVEIAASAEHRLALSGSIMANKVYDVWNPYEFLSPGCLGYSTVSSFKDRYSHVRKVNNWIKYEGNKNLDELKERMARCSFLVTKEQCLDLPPKTYQTVKVEMSERQSILYASMADSFLSVVDEEQGPDGIIEAKAVIAQILRLSQITSGFLPTPDGGIHRIDGGEAKAEAAYEIITGASGKVLVWCRFREDIRFLADYLAKRDIQSTQIHGGIKDRKVAENLFNADNDVKVLIGEPGTGGIGLNLLGPKEQRCLSTIYYSQDWNLLKRLQSEDRNHRIGLDKSEGPVTYYDLVAVEEDESNTIDATISSNLLGKKDLADALKNVSTIRELLLQGRRPPPVKPKERTLSDVRALLSEQGIRLKVAQNSTEGCESFDHDDGPCKWCSGDPMTAPSALVLSYIKGGQAAMEEAS